MPPTTIDVFAGRSAEDKRAVIQAVHDALVESLRILDHDRKYRLREYTRDEMMVPPGASDRYTIVEISMFPGRSLDAKRRLYQAIVRNLGRLGTPPTDGFITLHEPPMENWGIRGGIPASEVDLGFEVNV